MTSNLQIFDFQSSPVRIVDKAGVDWFVAPDVASALHIANIRKRLEGLDEDEKATVALSYTSPELPTQERLVNVISESGLYTLILRCDDALKPGTRAYEFRRWVTHEVLPTLRRKKAYSLVEKADKETAEAERAAFKASALQKIQRIESRAGYAADGLMFHNLSLAKARTVYSLGRLQFETLRLLLEADTVPAALRETEPGAFEALAAGPQAQA
jgi:prophage antirepressor-like protein